MNFHHKPRVVHCVPDIALHSGGPSRSVVGLADSLSLNSDLRVSLLTNLSKGIPNPPKSQNIEVIDCTGMPPFGRISELFKICGHLKPDGPQVIHNHGLWTLFNQAVSFSAIKSKTPLVVSPRGMLEKWSLEQKYFKKKLALHLYQMHFLRSAAMFFATARDEATSIRRLGLRQPIAIIPNGIEIPIISPRGMKHHSKKRQVLFLSRIHPKKGLIDLIDAWKATQPKDWQLAIAGPDEGGFLSVVKRHITESGLDASIKYIGSVNGEEKSDLFFNSDLFVLPTFSENFGIVIAEALAHGVPVITTKGTPWSDIDKHNCGWWIDIGQRPLSEALRLATSLPPEELMAMGRRGIDVAKKFGWNDIAEKSSSAYFWLLGGGAKPDHIDTA